MRAVVSLMGSIVTYVNLGWEVVFPQGGGQPQCSTSASGGAGGWWVNSRRGAAGVHRTPLHRVGMIGDSVSLRRRRRGGRWRPGRSAGVPIRRAMVVWKESLTSTVLPWWVYGMLASVRRARTVGSRCDRR
jgi:hypothetical protein